MQCASSTTSSPVAADSFGSTLSRKSGLFSRSGETSSTSTAPAATSSWIGVPLLGVGRVDGAGRDAGPGGGLDLVAHQGEQRRDDHRGARAARRAAARSPRSTPRTCPSRCAARRAPAACRRPAPRSPATGPRAAARCPWRPRRDGPGPCRPRYAVPRCSCAPCPHTTGRVGQSRYAAGPAGPSAQVRAAPRAPPTLWTTGLKAA